MDTETNSTPDTCPMHVYDWLDLPAQNEEEKQAKEWLEQFVKPAIDKDQEWLNARKLTCVYEGKRYRCIGASCMGDVWLTSNMQAENGYEYRVDVESLSQWELTKLPKSRGNKLTKFLGAAALLAGCGLGYFGTSSYAERNDPSRPKTPSDLKHMEAAQRKRERKAKRNNQ